MCKVKKEMYKNPKYMYLSVKAYIKFKQISYRSFYKNKHKLDIEIVKIATYGKKHFIKIKRENMGANL